MHIMSTKVNTAPRGPARSVVALSHRPRAKAVDSVQPMSEPVDEKLAALLGEDKDVLAARLFAASFTSGVRNP